MFYPKVNKFLNAKRVYYVALLFIFIAQAMPALAQNGLTVSGVVKDESGSVLPGVTVLLKGTSTGSATDTNGSYRLPLQDGGGTLVFSFIGFVTQEVLINNQTEINVILRTDTKTLEEVVVVGYGTLDKKEVTSAVTHVSGEDLLTVAATNPLMSLQGKVAGLTISNSGGADPNAGPSIQLRGVSSRDAGLGPLIVINGVPGGSLDNINQNDIESIDVLKGGAASAIYGTRGSNGVIIVTTKAGTGELRAEYSGYTSFDLLSNQELRPLSAEKFIEENRGTDFGARTNWLDEVTKKYAFAHKHTLSVSGGDRNNSYRATADYRDAEGLDLRSGREEYGARIMLNHTAKSNLYSVGFTIAPRYYTRRDADYEVFTRALTLNPTMPVRNPDNPVNYFNINTGYDNPYNPVERLETELSGSEAKILDWNASFKLNILPTLNTQLTVGQFSTDFFDFFFRPSTSTYALQNQGGMNSASRASNKYNQRSLEWIGNYDLDFKEHSFKVLGGYSYQQFENSGISVSNRDFPSDALTYNNIGTGLYAQVEGRNEMGSFKNTSKLIAFFGRVNYSFKDKYLASASVRYEGSSKFGYSNKWGYFPAASIGWRISEESFMDGFNWVNELKLRADYGVTGNQDFGNYLSLDTYTGYGYYLLNNEFYQVWGPNQNTNYDLRWEKAKNTNFGIDFSIFDYVVSGSINYYTRKNEDLLGWYNVQLPPNLVNQTYANVGTMKNSGLELQLNANIINKENFTYNISLAGATNQNEFVSFSNEQYEGQSFIDVVGLPAPGSPGNAQRLEEGRRVGSFYMLRSAGVNDQGALLVYNNAGDIIPADQARNEDRQYVGNGLPKFTGSIGNTVKYKNWDASLFLRGNFGYDLFNTHAFYTGTPATQAGANLLESAYDGGKYSKLTNSSTSVILSDYFLEKGDFMKIDNVTVGYTFSFNSKFARSLRVYAAGRNLATFTSFTGGDPDRYPVNGLYPGINATRSFYPATTQVLLGVNFGF
ncbi:SusC/RagA family TonB-linked outer membrane protein [Pontibacter sp. SGAir0037]|nr:SusC/RagA family TonB-linked outer membrane protein [Pontibacter sp. SGAir0037]